MENVLVMGKQLASVSGLIDCEGQLEEVRHVGGVSVQSTSKRTRGVLRCTAGCLGSWSRDGAVPWTGSSNREDNFASDVFPSGSWTDEPLGRGESAAVL